MRSFCGHPCAPPPEQLLASRGSGRGAALRNRPLARAPPLTGSALAQTLLTRLGFTDPIVRGAATAASAHGLGTAALSAKEPDALPVAALVLSMMGIVASVLAAIPAFRGLLLSLAGA